jgi:hypothetical protein
VYLRHTTRRKDGKSHVYWQLVRSVRRGRKVVQETVAQLGKLDAAGRARAEALARSIAGRARESWQGQLFDRSEPTGSVAVKLDRVRLERSRSFGAVWLGWFLWRALKLDEQCEALLASMRSKSSSSIGTCIIFFTLLLAMMHTTIYCVTLIIMVYLIIPEEY